IDIERRLISSSGEPTIKTDEMFVTADHALRYRLYCCLCISAEMNWRFACPAVLLVGQSESLYVASPLRRSQLRSSQSTWRVRCQPRNRRGRGPHVRCAPGFVAN